MSFKIKFKQALGSVFPAKKRMAKRTKSGKSLNENPSVAILFKHVDENCLKARRAFLQRLKGEYGIRNVIALTYVDEFQEDIPIYLGHLKELDYFCKEDLNWRLEPKNIISGFCKGEYDILIDLTDEKCDALEHIISNSKAKMKVGRVGCPHQDYLDVIFEVSERESEEGFLKHAEYYLSNLSFN